MTSRGTLKDVMVLNYASSMMQVSLNGAEEAIQRSEDNKNYHLNKRIERRVEALRERTETICKSVMSNLSNDEKDYLSKRLNKVASVMKWLEKEQININLELLALYVIYVNFTPNERGNQKLDDRFKELTNPSDYFDTNADMIASTLKHTDAEEKMFMLAYEIVSKLKG